MAERVHSGICAELDRLLSGRAGVCETRESVRRFRDRLGHLVPEWYTEMMSLWALGRCVLDVVDDETSSLYWLTLDQTIEEAFDFFPGGWVREHGYVPVAGCAMGGGDPYFMHLTGGQETVLAGIDVDTSNPPILQIYHNKVDETGALADGAYRIVADSFSELLRSVRVCGVIPG